MHVHFIQEKTPPFHTTDHPAKSCVAAEVPNPRTDFLLIGKVQTGARWADVVVDGIHGPGLAFLLEVARMRQIFHPREGLGGPRMKGYPPMEAATCPAFAR